MVTIRLPGQTTGAPSSQMTYTAFPACSGAQTVCYEVDAATRTASGTQVTQRAFYDGAFRLVETRTPAPDGMDTVSDTLYDVSGRVSQTSAPYLVAAYTGAPGAAAYALPDSSVPATQYRYDGLGRVTTVTDPLGHSSSARYQAVCNAAGTQDPACYSETLAVDADAHQQASLADGLGRVIYTQAFTGTSSASYALSRTVTTTYDALGRTVAIRQPDGVHSTTFTYDTAGRLMAMRDPDRGAESYSYDPNGNVTETVDARGASGTIYAGYDALNRQLWRNTTPSATGAYVTYGYDSTANGNVGVGRLTSETFSNANVGGTLAGAYAYTYDALGRVTGTTETLGAASYTTSATYNDAGQLLSQTYPDGDTLSHSYDSASGWERQRSLRQSGAPSAVALLGGETYAGAAGARGLLTSATLGGFALGAGTYSASYDALGRLTSAADSYTPAGGAASALYQVQPTYDALGNVTGVTTTLPQGTDTQVFCYDDLSRLTWAGSSGTPACSGALTPSDTGSLAGTGAAYSASYTYDTLDRLTSSPLGAYSYGDTAHLDAATAIGSGGSAWSASYDASGNMTCRAASGAQTCAGASPTGATLAYDTQGQLAAWQNTPSSPTSSASYLYDGEGHRVQQVATTSGTTTTTSYIGSLEDIATTGATTTTTAYYGSLALSVNGALSYTLSDGLGSVSESVNASSGVVTATQLYASYGAVRYQSGALPTSHGYTGQRADAVSGLDYYGARYYDPLAGQFTSADTTLAGGLNRYAYVSGNPETWVDPTGAYAQECDAECGGGGDGVGVPGGAPDPTLSEFGRGGSDSSSTAASSQSSSGETPINSTAGSAIEGEPFRFDPVGDGTPQGLETGEQYHLDEVRQAETKAHTTTGNEPSTSTSATDRGTARVSYVAKNMGTLAPSVDTSNMKITVQEVDKPFKFSTNSYLPDITTNDSWWEVTGPGKLIKIEGARTQITRLAQGAREYGVTPYYAWDTTAWDTTDTALPSELQRLLIKWKVNVIQFNMQR